MRIPSIFQWPSPWIWGALAVLILTNAESFFDFVQGAATVTLIAAGVYVIRSRTCGRRAAAAAPASMTGTGGLDERLQTIERRLTDTQDVMIALSEKVDQWEAERTRPEGRTVDSSSELA